MAMKKIEMEDHQQRYKALMRNAREAERSGLYRLAVENALASWQYIDGMMQYERRYQQADFNSIDTIDMILKYAPLLFDYTSLDKLATLLKECRRIEKNTSEHLATKLAAARESLWNNHRLWNHLELNPCARQDMLRRELGGDQNVWRAVAEIWEKMGLIRRTLENGSYRLSLSTRLGEITYAKCPSCGDVAEAPKAMFLESMNCLACKNTVTFILLPSSHPAVEQE